MLQRLQRLVQLQRFEDELLALEEEHRALPERRARMQTERESLQSRREEAAGALQTAQGEQRASERALQEQEALLHKLEGQQFQVKSNEAYTALLHEMEHAKQAISDCETRILEAMEAIESASAAVAAAEHTGRTREAGLREQELALDAREKELAERIANVREGRDSIAAQIEAEDFALYSRVASRKRPAVVLVTTSTCLGCRVTIPPQRYIELLRAERLVTCLRCQRILIHRERLAAAS